MTPNNWLDDSEETRKHKIIPHFVHLCARAGFSLVRQKGNEYDHERIAGKEKKENTNRQWHNVSCIISGNGQKKQRL
jgi:hypothetical protein